MTVGVRFAADNAERVTDIQSSESNPCPWPSNAQIYTQFLTRMEGAYNRLASIHSGSVQRYRPVLLHSLERRISKDRGSAGQDV